MAGFHAWRNKELTDRLIANGQVQKIYVLNGCDILWANDFIFPDPKIYLIDNYYETLIKRNLNWQYFKDNYTLFFQTYHWLEDEKSRKTMVCYLKGHIELKEFSMLEVWETADVEKQYFPEDLIRMSEEEVFVDCGAYTGDTLEAFLKRTNGFIKYYALEPDGRYFDELRSKMTDHVVHIPICAWDKKECLHFSVEKACGEIVTEGNEMEDRVEKLWADKVDNLIDHTDRVTFIKMDIEGAELPALRGAQKIIKKDKPKLAICVYHKREDLITIPQYIKSIVPEYSFYLRGILPMQVNWCYMRYVSEEE